MTPGWAVLNGKIIDIGPALTSQPVENSPRQWCTINITLGMGDEAMVTITTEDGSSTPIRIEDVGEDYMNLLERIQRELMAKYP